MARHIVQSPEWGAFKTEYGTPAVSVGNIQYTKHHIPISDLFFAYCPKVNPKDIDFDLVKKSLEENNCVSINFDVPNVIKGSDAAAEAIKMFQSHGCVLSPRDQFAKSNVILDLTKSEEELLSNMHYKQRYNIKYAEKSGLTTTYGETQKDFDTFWELFETTSVRQKYYIRPKSYYQKIWEMLAPEKIAHIVTVSFNNEALASWMLFKYENILYYPYGGSSENYKNLQGSTYVGWQAILLGKKLSCAVFDMWGASSNINDKSDPWWGFTNFKLKFGGQYITYIDSYDYVVNRSMYKLFSTANDVRWKVLKFLK